MPDGTYLLSGYTDSATGSGASRGDADFWAVRVDALGRVIWSLHYGGSGYEDPSDNTLVLVGVKDHASDKKAKAWVVKVQMR